MASEVYDTLVIKQLRMGKYVAGIAASSTGYIIIKDEEGTDRKLMVQA